jgi:hypothetical protein
MVTFPQDVPDFYTPPSKRPPARMDATRHLYQTVISASAQRPRPDHPGRRRVFGGEFLREHADDAEAAMSAMLAGFRAGFFRQGPSGIRAWHQELSYYTPTQASPE